MCPLALGFIGVCADDILGDGDAVFRLAVGAERLVGVLVALLFVRGTVTLHGTLAFILVSLFRDAWLNGLSANSYIICRFYGTHIRDHQTGRNIEALHGQDPSTHRGGWVHDPCHEDAALSQKEAEGFYAVHRERPFFKGLTEFMASGPIVALVLEAPDAIKKWRTLMGATDPAKADAGTIRKEFASSIGENATHGSDAPETAAFEIGYFFAGMELVE